MKYILKVLIVLILLPCFIYGQEEHKLSIGVLAAPSVVMWYNTNPQQDIYKSQLSFIGGITAQYYIKPWFVLCANVNYERKGRSIDWSKLIFFDMIDSNSASGTQNNKNVKVKGYMDYITLPLITKFKLGGKRIYFFANIGMYMGYLVKAGLYDIQNGRENPNEYKRLDIGLVNGLEVSIPIKKHFQFSIEARNNLGCLKILKDKNNFAKNESFALLFGLAYKI